MAGISPKLPMSLDGDDGFSLNNTFREAIAQNLKHLCLTCPGERIMDPNFGVGLRNFLFEKNTDFTKGSKANRISIQTGIYMPFIALEDIQISDTMNENGIHIRIIYNILPLGVQDILQIAIDTAKNTTAAGL